jgi:hypothetical protein
MDYEKVLFFLTLLLFFLTLLLIGVTVAGVVKRGRLRLCRMFLLFLVVVFLTEILPVFWPEKFWNQAYYLKREPLLNVFRFAVALELAYFAFRSFPGARSTARLLLLLLLTTTLAFVVLSTWEMSKLQLPEYNVIIAQIQLPHLIGVVWLLLGITMLILWYRLPVDRMHKAILLGWVPFLIVFSLGLRLSFDPDAAFLFGWKPSIEQVNAFTSGAYFLLLTYWARAAWSPVGAQARFREPLTVPARQAS